MTFFSLGFKFDWGKWFKEILLSKKVNERKLRAVNIIRSLKVLILGDFSVPFFFFLSYVQIETINNRKLKNIRHLINKSLTVLIVSKYN